MTGSTETLRARMEIAAGRFADPIAGEPLEQEVPGTLGLGGNDAIGRAGLGQVEPLMGSSRAAEGCNTSPPG